MSEEKKSFFSRLKDGLSKTRNNIVNGIDSVFNGFSNIDDDFYEELEEILVMGDIGIHATNEIIERLKQQVKEQHIKEPSQCKQLLIDSIREQMQVGEMAYEFEHAQSVVLVIGVNGVGKTTSVGKLAGKLKDQGRKVLLAAADTFRAAAVEQLGEWAHRANVDIIAGNENADPASVIFDAVNAAKARKVDVLLCDTAGRLHNKKNLMEELKKMNRIIDKEFPNAHRENLVVLDSTTGQNALAQAREFGEVANLTGIILTKMDGTAKGGIAVAIQSELKVPVKYIGVGETIDDLQKFDADQFVDALFDVKRDAGEEADADAENVSGTQESAVQKSDDTQDGGEETVVGSEAEKTADDAASDGADSESAAMSDKTEGAVRSGETADHVPSEGSIKAVMEWKKAMAAASVGTDTQSRADIGEAWQIGNDGDLSQERTELPEDGEAGQIEENMKTTEADHMTGNIQTAEADYATGNIEKSEAGQEIESAKTVETTLSMEGIGTDETVQPDEIDQSEESNGKKKKKFLFW